MGGWALARRLKAAMPRKTRVPAFNCMVEVLLGIVVWFVRQNKLLWCCSGPGELIEELEWW